METPVKIEVEDVVSRKEYDQLQFKYQNLKQQLTQLQRMIFGSKSERFVSSISADSQIDLFTGTSALDHEPLKQQEVSYTRNVPSKKKQKPVRLALPPHLPRVEEIIEPDSIAPGAKKIGEEITEILEYNPANIYVRKIIRPKG